MTFAETSADDFVYQSLSINKTLEAKIEDPELAELCKITYQLRAYDDGTTATDANSVGYIAFKDWVEMLQSEM
jgi:hypothetical protein